MTDEPTIEEAIEWLAGLAEEGIFSETTAHHLRTLLASHASLEESRKEAVRLLTICDEQRRRQTNRGLGEFGASAAEIDFRRGLDGMIADFLAAFVNEKERT